MKIKLMTVGRTSTPYLAQGIETYCKRIVRYIPFEIVTLPDVRATRSMTEEQQREAEGNMILATVKPSESLVLLDERGKELTSRGFAEFLQKKMAGGASKGLVFVVGGPYGFSQKVYDRADSLLSLSRMTFSHEMVRLFFTEQIYRALTILHGEPYHHD